MYEVMWKNIEEPGRPQMAIWRMRFACWIHKVTNTHSEYVILITFPMQQWLHDCTSVLCFVYFISCLFVCEYCSFCSSFLFNLVNILQITNGQLLFRSLIISFQNTEKLNYTFCTKVFYTHFPPVLFFHNYPSD
jgi:hypothetical protein